MITGLRYCQQPLGSLPAAQALARPCTARSRPLRASVVAMSAKEAMHGHYVASLGEALYGRAFAAAAVAAAGVRFAGRDSPALRSVLLQLLPTCHRLPGQPDRLAGGQGGVLVSGKAERMPWHTALLSVGHGKLRTQVAMLLTSPS